MFTAGHAVVLQPNFARMELLKAQQRGTMQINLELGDINDPVDPPVIARINAAYMGGRWGWKGRWIADCKADRGDGSVCAGAEMVDFKIPSFMCCSCFNRAANYKWRRLQLPPEGRVAIERALLRRPQARIHNWEPYESLEDLIEQNHMLGIEPEVAKRTDLDGVN